MPEPAWTSVVAAPLRRESAIDVTPDELGEDAVVERMRHRARLKHLGRAWVRLDSSPISEPGSGIDDDAIDELMPVIGETPNRIRVVTEEDGARVALWVDRREVWDSVVAPVPLETSASPAPAGRAGVWLEPGAAVTNLRPRGRGARSLDVHDEAVELRGSVPPAFLGHVWIVRHDDRTKTAMAQGSCPPPIAQPPPDPGPQMTLAEGSEIRAAASETAPVLATLLLEHGVTVISRGAEWAEIELRRPHARIRGHVAADTLGEVAQMGTLIGGCSGRGFGMSHTDRIDVPAGTCLFDRASGDVAGVALEGMVRLGTRGRAGDEWSMVYVNTRWSIASLYVRDIGRDPTQPVLESCVQRRHRK